MSLIGNILPMQHIVLDLEVGSKKRLFEHIALLLENECGISKSAIFDCLFAREKLGSTGLGQGVAVPHGSTAEVQTAVGVFVRVKEPLPFDSPDNKPVSLVFALLVPAQATGEHLEILSQLASKFVLASNREILLSTDSIEKVHRLLTEE